MKWRGVLRAHAGEDTEPTPPPAPVPVTLGTEADAPEVGHLISTWVEGGYLMGEIEITDPDAAALIIDRGLPSLSVGISMELNR